jgi:hypothetical protein
MTDTNPPAAVRRVAKKYHRCNSCDHTAIKPGQPYLSGVVFPGHDLIPTDVPLRLSECASCATRYGRAHLLESPNA